uniref:Yippee domain-containing protein n=1 Tax=Salix viminalis TaxID=40686 RepID=A0A6N2NM37_SALVM
MMLSGMHTVADIFCCCCGGIIGWKYEAAHETSQKYKRKEVCPRKVQARTFLTVTDFMHLPNRGRIVVEMDFSAELFIDIHPE